MRRQRRKTGPRAVDWQNGCRCIAAKSTVRDAFRSEVGLKALENLFRVADRRVLGTSEILHRSMYSTSFCIGPGQRGTSTSCLAPSRCMDCGVHDLPGVRECASPSLARA